MSLPIIDIELSANADYQAIIPIVDEAGAAVTMTGWEFKLTLKKLESDATGISMTLSSTTPGEIDVLGSKTDFATLLGTTDLKLKAYGDLLVKISGNVLRIAKIKAVIEKGYSTL